jgi:ATP-dependent Clp protease ATP-binding subunit ClpC
VLQSAVQGQQAAVAAIIGALRLSRMGLAPHQHNPQQLNKTAGSARPALSLLFQGPSGVGKTTMAKTLAEALLPGESQGVLVFSCGEFSERHSISRLVGAPPGYVGYGRGGVLTEAVRRRPHSCVVFDDVERAHPDVVGLLLQVSLVQGDTVYYIYQQAVTTWTLHVQNLLTMVGTGMMIVG